MLEKALGQGVGVWLQSYVVYRWVGDPCRRVRWAVIMTIMTNEVKSSMLPSAAVAVVAVFPDYWPLHFVNIHSLLPP